MFTRNTIKDPAEHDHVVNQCSGCSAVLLADTLSADLNVCALNQISLEHET